MLITQPKSKTIQNGPRTSLTGPGVAVWWREKKPNTKISRETVPLKQMISPAHPEDDVLEDDDEGKLERQDLPVDGGEVALVVPEATVEARLLQQTSYSEAEFAIVFAN